ncbi:MAG: glycosyl hydrolase family 65 protein [Vicinamibacterales bacterium]
MTGLKAATFSFAAAWLAIVSATEPPRAGFVTDGGPPAVQGSPKTSMPSTIPRFHRPASPVALTGDARPSRYMEASGRKAAFLGREDGTFEAWVYPLKVLHDFNLSFGVSTYADPIPGSALAATVDIRPEASTVRYAHALFTVDATWFVPLDEMGGLVLLDISTSEPLTIVVRFKPDLKPMWPAGLGGQYSYWDASIKAYVIGEGSGKNAALVGSPLGLEPPEQPAHNLPDAPSQFSIRVTPEDARRGLVPIVITASVEKLEPARQVYARLLASAAALYSASVTHAARLREEFTSIDTPDDRLDLAFEWGKVALDKGFVCNPHLGCGLIAGLGPSGTTERPGFGWYFGGDTFINSWAMTAYGDFATVRASLDFLRGRQRADGKMMHELSQSAGMIRWFEDYPYGYYHADTTPLYIVAVDDYVRASGDEALAKEFWPSLRKAYDYCLSTDEDGDGLMDNTKAGLAAVETGALRRRDVLTDVFLAAAWTEATGAMADLASIAEPAFRQKALDAAAKARTSLNRRFLDDQNRRIHFAVMKDGIGQSERTVWPGFGIWRGVFDRDRPAVEGMLDELAGWGIGADWGARMLSRESKLYQPTSYNNGAAWPFLTGFAALALYAGDRAPAAWGYLDGTADLAFLEARGYIAELFSGDRLRPVDAAVPHQLFATTGFVSTVMRGLVGLRPAGGTGEDDTHGRLRLAPRLPSGWDHLRVSGIHWRGAVFDLRVWKRHGDRGAASTLVAELTPRRGTPDIEIELALPPGATIVARRAAPAGFKPVPEPSAARLRGARPAYTGLLRAPERIEVAHRKGFSIVPVHEPLTPGDSPHRLRIIDTTFENGIFSARLQGLRGRTYRVRLDTPVGPITLLEGGRRDESGEPEFGSQFVDIPIPEGSGEWGEVTLRVRIGTG